MFRRPALMKHSISVFFLALLGAIRAASAETLLELDFQNVTGTETKASAGNSRGSDTGELLNDAQIDLGPTGIDTGMPGLRKGSLIIDRQMKGASLALKNLNAGGRSNSAYTSFIGGPGFGTSTIAFVFQPNFTTAGRSNVLFCTNATSTQAGFMALRVVGKGLMLILGAKDAASTVEIADAGWESGQWYFIAASWQQDSPPNLFVCPLKGSGIFAEGTKPVIGTGAITQGVRIGNGHDIKELPSGQMDGRLAYFLWANDFTGNAAGYDTLFKRIVDGK